VLLFYLQDGQLYIADYAILADIPTVRRDTDTRYLAAPLALFVVRDPGGDLIPIAIQLGQDPGPDNPVWTPRDNPEDWIMAKLWVRCADFQIHYAISHLLKTHLIVEPFAVAMMRQLSSSHPIFKLLKPHFRWVEFSRIRSLPKGQI
jgi:Lipoxygenase